MSRRAGRSVKSEWIFTFGFGHLHPETGEKMADRYVRIPGEFDQARETMVRRFGLKWAFQYGSEDEAGVSRFGLTEFK